MTPLTEQDHINRGVLLELNRLRVEIEKLKKPRFPLTAARNSFYFGTLQMQRPAKSVYGIIAEIELHYWPGAVQPFVVRFDRGDGTVATKSFDSINHVGALLLGMHSHLEGAR